MTLFILCVNVFGCSTTPSQEARKLAQTTHRYYIDATQGDDKNSGESETSAWKTLAPINETKLGAGDSILLKRGQIWHESLTINGSGTFDAPIQIASYGTGPSPVLSGSVNISAQTWIQTNENVWSTALQADASPPQRIFVDGVPLDDRLTKISAKDLSREGQWAWEETNGGSLYIYSTRSPLRWNKLIEVNLRRRGIMLGTKSFISIKDIKLMRFREGVWIGGTNCSVENITSNENSFAGVTITGSSNSLRNTVTSKNGVDVTPGDSDAHGLGVLVDGSDNIITDFVSDENSEDGVQVGPAAGSGNQFINASMQLNRENCFDIKSGNQLISGGVVKSNAPSSADCVIVHKVPHHVVIKNLRASSTTKGPAAHVLQGASIEIDRSWLQSEDSSALLIGDEAGDGSSMTNSVIAGGGRVSKNLIEIRSGRSHVIENNRLTIEDGVKGFSVVPTAAATLLNNKILTTK